jgi:hypothetical protein
MRRSIDRRVALPLAALALAGALCAPTAGAAPPRLVGENGPFGKDLPLPESEPQACSYRKPAIALKPGQYELTLHVRRNEKEAKPKTQPFTISATKGRTTGRSAGFFQWRDCFKRERVGDRVRVVHTAQLDADRVRGAEPVTGDVVQPIVGLPVDSDDTNRRFDAWSQVHLIKAAAPKKPPQRKPPRKPNPRPAPSGGDDAPCDDDSFKRHGEDVQVCPDWAPTGKLIPVRQDHRRRAPIVDYIDPSGEDWYECQTLGAAFTNEAGDQNTWWAYTLGDGYGADGRDPGGLRREGWVSETYFQGGGPNQPDATLRHCPPSGP